MASAQWALARAIRRPLAFDAFAKGIHSCRQELLGYLDQPTIQRLRAGVINKPK